MRRLHLLTLILALLLPALPAAAQTSGDEAETPPERLVSEDGRLQAVDAAGWPMFDAEGNPIWEQTPEEQANQLFTDAMRASEGLAPASTAWQFSVVPPLRQALELKPDFHEARFNLAMIYLQVNDLEGAVQELETLIQSGTEIEGARAALGLAYERLGRLNDADLAYARGLAIKDKDVDLLNGQARVLLKRGRAGDAERAAKAILRINSNSVDAFNTLGLAYLEMGRFETARFVFQKAMSLPGAEDKAVLASLRTNLGLVFWRQGKEFLAEAEFNAVAVGAMDENGVVTQPPLDPNNAAARVNLAHIRLANLDYQGARELLEPAYQQLKGNEIVQMSYAVALRGTGDYERAEQLYDEIAADSDSDLRDDALLNLGILEGDFLKDYDAAIETYNEYIGVRESMGSPVAEDEPVREYLKEMEKLKRKRDRKRERDAREAEEAAAEAAEAAAQPEPEPEPEPTPEPAPEEPAPADEPTPEPTPVPADEGGTP